MKHYVVSAIVSALIALGTTEAFASGINLSWQDCGSAGVRSVNWACDANLPATANPHLYAVASFVPPSSAQRVIGLEAVVHWTGDQASLVPWWQFGTQWIDPSTTGPDGCRKADLVLKLDTSALAGGCVDYFGQIVTVGGALTVYGLPDVASGKTKVNMAGVFDLAAPLDATTEYYAFYLSIDKLKTVGGGSCAGCSNPVAITLDYITLYYADNSSVTLTQPINSTQIFWQTPQCWDLDGDGYVSSACAAPGDCDDNDPTIHPGAPDRTCNGIDENCNRSVDEGNAGCVCIENGPGLFGWWPGNGNPTDLKAGNNGTLTNGASYAAGMVGQAFSFDGVDDYVANLGGTATYSFIQNTGIFTINAWIKLNDPNAQIQQAISANTTTSLEQGHFFIWENTGGVQRLRLGLMKGISGIAVIEAASPTQVITDASWHHVAAVGDGARITFYVDGVGYLGSGVMTAKPTGNSTRPVDIGRCPYATPQCHFSGRIDELQIHDRGLSAAEIRAIYNTGSNGMCGLGAVAVDEPAPSAHPFEFSMPWPNPATRELNLEFRLPVSAVVRAEVFDVAGHRVKELLPLQTLAAGDHRHTWDVRGTSGRRVAPGIYLIWLSTSAASAARRIVVVE